MKRNRYLSLGACILFCGITAAASWASSEEDIQKNLHQLIASKQCLGCDLRRTDLTRMDLQGANLQGADLSEAKLSLTNLSRANLKNAVLQRALLGGADLAGADLRGADLTDAQLAGAYLKEALLDENFSQKKSSVSSPEEVLPEEDVISPETSPADTGILKKEGGASGVAETVSEETAVPFSSLNDEEEIEMESVAPEVSEAPLSTATNETEGQIQDEEMLPDIEKRVATTVRSKKLVPLEDPQEAVSQDATLEQKEKTQIEQHTRAYSVETFAQSRIRLQGLIDKLLEKRRCVACDLAGADLRNQDLEEVDLERADFTGAQLEGTDLRAANLKGVQFTDANLKNADLREADLYQADFSNANLTGAQLEGALTDSTDFSGSIGARLEEAQEAP